MLKRILLSGLILFAGILFLGGSHKFYVSITQVDVNDSSHKLEISARIFTDDLQASVLAETGVKLGLGSGKEHLKADSILTDYLRSTLTFKQDAMELEWVFIGKEVDADVTWFYLETREGILLEKAVEIHNGFLYERFPDQKNIVNLMTGKQTVSQIHTKSHQDYSYAIVKKPAG